MVLAIEIDTMIADFQTSFKLFAAMSQGKQIEHMPELTQYGFYEWCCTAGKTEHQLLHDFGKNGGYEILELLPFVREAFVCFKYWEIEFKVLTNRDTDFEDETLRWLKEKLNFIDWETDAELEFTKGMSRGKSITGDLFIEDSPVEIEGLCSYSRDCIVYSQPYNIGVIDKQNPAIKEIASNWEEVAQCVAQCV